MKKIYLLLTVGVLTLSAILITKYAKLSDKQLFSEEFTPEEFWQKQFLEKKVKRKQGYSKADKPDMYSKYFRDITTIIGDSKSGYLMNYKTEELQKARNMGPRLKSSEVNLKFIQRGPANVGGRTRTIVVDPDDPMKKTWFAGSASGGIWKTTDGAENWTNLSNDLTNLSVNALFMSSSNHDIIYAGTGESFPGSANNLGNGIWKSVDRGIKWTQLASTANNIDFSYVNRLWVNPSNADIVIAATEAGLYRTTNGGEAWLQVYKSNPRINGVEDLSAYPEARDTIFAGENSKGILRTVDGGLTWELFSKGLASGTRYEVAVSPVNRNFVYTSVNISRQESAVFFSEDNANNWAKFNSTENFLGGQGGYDNAITAHPFIDSVVYVAGVNMWKLAFNKTTTAGVGAIKSAYTDTADFLSFISAGGSHLNGGLGIPEGSNALPTDWTSVEIRFGNGMTQKAHRFTVPSQATSGVLASSYFYVDYVEVPFQVWDTENDRQLMVSFRDQEIDGKYNIYTRKGDSKSYGDLSREYIYINAVEYNSEAADENIAVNGGHLHKALYMIWPELKEGSTWNPENLPSSKIVVEYAGIEIYDGEETSVADAYGNNGGPNQYRQDLGDGKTKIPGVHPDHHNITIIPLEGNNFRIVNGNDGGIGVSEDNGIIFNQKPNNYITTQFYGVAKNPNANEYIGGMQDNGTWQSAVGVDASLETNYYFRIGGDGFECLWHSTDSEKLLGSVYNNAIMRTINGGETWFYVDGIAKNDGPFITRLSNSKLHPDVVFAVGNNGIYKSTDFGANWNLKPIGEYWSDGTVRSVHNVEVSLADPNIVWAGAGMINSINFKIHVSKDEGETFSTVNMYSKRSMNAYISGISTHPTEPNTAYLLYSISNMPKILRTTDLGENWEDISGFGTGDESTNGFPDVVTQCLLVMPNNPQTIWAGTEIGVFESTDNGDNWHAVVGDIPPVSIYDMHFVGDQVVIATHGRGIWSVDIPVVTSVPVILDLEEIRDHIVKLGLELKVAYDYIEIYINDEVNTTIQNPTKGLSSYELDVENAGVYNSYVIAYIDKNEYKSNQEEIEVKDKMPTINGFEIINYYTLNLQVEIPVRYDKYEIYINDVIFKTIEDPTVGSANFDISIEDAGIYSSYIIGYMLESSFISNSKVVEVISTGIETIQENLGEMKIYPNPCQGTFKLQLDNSIQDFSLEIFDLSGKKVYSKKDKNIVDNIIRVESLINGFYVVRVTMAGKVISRKIQII